MNIFKIYLIRLDAFFFSSERIFLYQNEIWTVYMHMELRENINKCLKYVL